MTVDDGVVQIDVLNVALEAFELGDVDVSITPGARGAQGQMWRLATKSRAFALKQAFAGAPSATASARVEAEIAFAQRVASAGVRLPTSHLDRTGRYVVPLTGGGWLRLYDWVELRPADLTAAADALGVLLARLHRGAPAADQEPGGGPPDPWYEVPPKRHEWEPLVTAANEADRPWAARLAAAVDGLPSLHALLSSSDPTGLRVCHRDLHPGNVLADADGELVVVDWEVLGPAEPARELARALVAFFHDGRPDLESMRSAYRAYVAAGGPARLCSTADFTMLIAAHLNFLNLQVRVALDPTALQRDRIWAELEVDEALRTLPTPDLTVRVLDALLSHGGVAG